MVPADLGTGVPDNDFAGVVALELVDDVDVDFAFAQFPHRTQRDGLDERQLAHDLAETTSVRAHAGDGKTAVDPVELVFDVWVQMRGEELEEGFVELEDATTALLPPEACDRRARRNEVHDPCGEKVVGCTSSSEKGFSSIVHNRAKCVLLGEVFIIIVIVLIIIVIIIIYIV